MQKAKPQSTTDTISTKIVVFKNLRDGALLLDEDDRVLFIKARSINMGTTQENGKTINRLIDPAYERQYEVIQIAKPKFIKSWIKRFKAKWNIKN
jgi:hypothetical protein